MRNESVISQEEKRLFGDKRILIVDDDISLANRIKRVLRNHGATDCNVELAHCIDTALDRLKQEVPFNLMILDMRMPETEEDLKAVEEERQKLERVRAILRTEDEISKEDFEAIEKVKVAYETRALILSHIHSLLLADGGVEILKGISSNNIHVQAIVVLSAFLPESRRRNFKNQTIDWMMKPISEHRLISICAGHLQEGSR
ncbi:response regulator [Candidatus Babeliales bacterium]|nr:response regulator [Candidatus Babeliales bacterium]